MVVLWWSMTVLVVDVEMMAFGFDCACFVRKSYVLSERLILC